MKALGAGNFKHDWFATQAVSLPDIRRRHLAQRADYIVRPYSDITVVVP